MDKPWGYSTLIKLKNCDKNLISDVEYGKKFLVDIIKFIKMTPFGEPIVVRFGKDPKVSGLSGFQLLEESNISFHFVDGGENGLTYEAYIDIFSCKTYDGDIAADFSAKYFQGEVEYCKFLER